MRIACMLLFMTILINSTYPQHKILFIDTAHLNSYCYNNFISIADQNGLEIDFKPFYELAPASLTTNTYSGVILSLDGLFLKKLAQDLQTEKTIKHPLVRSTLETVTQLAKKKNMLIGILLPSTNNAIAVYSILQFLLHEWHAYDDSTKKLLEPVLRATLGRLLQPDARKSSGYDTSLLRKKDNVSDLAEITMPIDTTLSDPQTNSLIAQTLPLTNSLSHNDKMLQKLLPFALYIHNPSTNNHFFIAKSSLVTFCDIQENFFINPIDESLRQKLLVDLQQSIQFIANKIKSSNNIRDKISNFYQYLKKKWYTSFDTNTSKPFILTNAKLASHYNWTKNGIWCGWTGLDAYKDKEIQAAENILKSGLNLIWIELNPEWYLSKNGIRKEQKEEFLKKIHTFTDALQQKSKELNLPIPHIFIGTDITSNFAQVPIQNSVTDLYANVYSKIPSPFDTIHFWKTELLDVLTDFINEWSAVSNGIPISGIFLDLEMYHAQSQTGQYLPIMDFSDTAWKLCCTAHNDLQALAIDSVERRIIHLQKTNTFARYIETLEKEANQIGNTIKKQIKQLLPEGIIAAYNLTLPSTWFYTGLLAGLSTPQEPVIFASFNNEYQIHKSFLSQKNIYLLHLPVLLLSKIKTINDFQLIKTLSKNHHGIWLNRLERLEQSRNPTDWPYDFGLEVTPLETGIFIEELRKTIEEQKR